MNPHLGGLRPEIFGTCDPKFQPVQDAFEQNFYARGADGEVGARCTVLIDGETVVDLWGGYADPQKNEVWKDDTLVCTWSVAKGACTTLGLMLVDQGKLDLDAPVATYWPEFGQNGKHEIPVRFLFDHRAALSWVDQDLAPGDLYDWDIMVAAIETTAPNFTPGSKEMYLNMTMGYLLGELFARVNGGRRLAQFMREDLSDPFDLDWHFAVRDEDLPRIARAIQQKPAGIMEMVRSMPDTPFAKSMKGFAENEDFNTLAWRKAQVGSGTMHGNARSLARMWGAIARGGELGGTRMFSSEIAALGALETVRGHDEILGVPVRFSTGYEMNNPPYHPMGPNPKSFGYWGAGGCFGFCDPKTKLSFGYSPNYMHPTLELGPRGTSLVEAATGVSL